MFNKWLTFGLSAEEEERFRQANFGVDIAQARICIWLVIAIAVAFTVNDYGFFGLTWRFYGLQALRVPLVAATFLLINSLRRMKSYRSYDRAEFAWGLSMAIFTVIVASTRPHAFTGHAIAVVVCVFVTLIAIPNRFTNQLTISLIYTVGETLVIVPNLKTSPQATVTALFSMFMANSIAVACARQFHSSRRREYLAREEGQKAKAEAERLLAERKLADEALRETRKENEFLANVIQQASQPFAVGYPDGSLGLFNKAFEQLTGYSAEELRRIDWATVLTPAEWFALEKESLDELHRTGKPVRYKKEYIRKDSSRVPIELLVHLARDAEGSPHHYFSFLTDITEHKRVEEELDKLARQRQLALDAAHMGWWHYDPITCMASWDDGYKEIFCVSDYQRPNEEILSRLHPDDLDGVWAKVEAALDPVNPQPYSAQYRINLPDGTMRWIEAYGIASFEGVGESRRAVSFVGTVADISERKQAEEALLESEERMRTQRQRMPIGCIIYDEHNCFSQLNPAAEAIFGYTEAELRGRHANVIVPEATLPHVDGILRRLAEGEMTAHSVNDNVTKEGRVITCQWTNTPLRDAAEKHIGFLSMVQDVTEKRKAEEALLLTQTSIDGAAEMVAWFTPDGRIHYVNDATCRTLGYSREELLKMTALDFSPGFTWEQYQEHWREIRERKSFNLETKHRRKDGSEYSAEILVNHVLYGGQEYIFAYGRDITKRKLAEEALKDSERRERERAEELTALFEAVPMPVFISHDPDCLHLTGNRLASEILRIPQGNELSLSGPAESRPRHFRPFKDGRELMLGELPAQRAARGTSVKDFEFSLVFEDGVIRHVLGYGTPLLDNQGRPRGTVAVLLDITERQQAEVALNSAHEELKKLVEERTRDLNEKEVLLKEIHHRVKNNMQVISSLVSLQADGTKDETVREVLKDVTYRVRSMALVHEKLYQSENLAQIDFSDYARSLLNYLWRAHGAVAATVRLTLDLESVLLPVDTAVPCGLILNELAGNALKHAFKDCDEGEVTVSLCSDEDGGVSLDVRDNGIGLKEGFDWRHSKSLGLRLVQMLSSQLDGNVEFSGEAGTQFKLDFKLKAEG